MADLLGRQWRAYIVATRAGQTLRLPVVVRVGLDAKTGQPRDIKFGLDQPAAKLNTQLEEISLAASVGLKNRVPLGAYVHNWIGQHFWPNGAVEGDEHVTECTSVIDYVGRALAARFDVGRATPIEPVPPPSAHLGGERA